MVRVALSTLRSDGVADGWNQARTVGLLTTVAEGAQVVVGTFVLPTNAQTAVVAWGGMMLAALGRTCSGTARRFRATEAGPVESGRHSGQLAPL